MSYKINSFPKEFKFGVASSAYQVEGAYNEDGRTDSMWDNICHNYSQIKGSGDIACDHYHKYKDDIKLMKSLGIKNYRLSISWNRILPKDDRVVNQKGIDFYNSLINNLLENGIEPYVTLYHFDLPYYLQEKGGWLIRQTISEFEYYAKVCFSYFGDRVKNWMSFNEPYIVGNMYTYMSKLDPSKRPIDFALKASHYLNVGHCLATKAYSNCKYNDGEIGLAVNLSMIYSNGEATDEAVDFADCLYNRFYLDYIYKQKYPKKIMTFIENHDIDIDLREEDLELFKNVRNDFIGINNYSRMIIGSKIDFLKFSAETMTLTSKENKNKDANYTEYGWEIYPKGLYDIIIHQSKLYNYPKIIISENGCACNDAVTDENNMVIDDDRIAYLDQYMKETLHAIKDGANVCGYFIWTLMDNFEWKEAYSIKMGLIKCDPKTLERIPKKSAYWYKNLITKNEEEKNE